jgi:hypothetical protein
MVDGQAAPSGVVISDGKGIMASVARSSIRTAVETEKIPSESAKN